MSILLRLARSRSLLPRMSDTEREAPEAGTVWVDGELFSGRPGAPLHDWSKRKSNDVRTLHPQLTR
jgi:hypothetical protein